MKKTEAISYPVINEKNKMSRVDFRNSRRAHLFIDNFNKNIIDTILFRNGFTDEEKAFLLKKDNRNKLKNYLTDTYNGAVDISYILRNENRDEFLGSRKIDNSKIRLVCREKLNLIGD